VPLKSIKAAANTVCSLSKYLPLVELIFGILGSEKRSAQSKQKRACVGSGIVHWRMRNITIYMLGGTVFTEHHGQLHPRSILYRTTDALEI